MFPFIPRVIAVHVFHFCKIFCVSLSFAFVPTLRYFDIESVFYFGILKIC